MTAMTATKATAMSKGLGRLQRTALELLAAHPDGLTVRQTARAVLGKRHTPHNHRAVARALRSLRDRGLVATDVDRRYRLLDAPPTSVWGRSLHSGRAPGSHPDARPTRPVTEGLITMPASINETTDEQIARLDAEAEQWRRHPRLYLEVQICDGYNDANEDYVERIVRRRFVVKKVRPRLVPYVLTGMWTLPWRWLANNGPVDVPKAYPSKKVEHTYQVIAFIEHDEVDEVDIRVGPRGALRERLDKQWVEVGTSYYHWSEVFEQWREQNLGASA